MRPRRWLCEPFAVWGHYYSYNSKKARRMASQPARGGLVYIAQYIIVLGL